MREVLILPSSLQERTNTFPKISTVYLACLNLVIELSSDLLPGMLRMSLYGLFPVQRSVLKAAGTGASVWLQESAAVQKDGWVVPATLVS